MVENKVSIAFQILAMRPELGIQAPNKLFPWSSPLPKAFCSKTSLCDLFLQSLLLQLCNRPARDFSLTQHSALWLIFVHRLWNSQLPQLQSGVMQQKSGHTTLLSKRKIWLWSLMKFAASSRAKQTCVATSIGRLLCVFDAFFLGCTHHWRSRTERTRERLHSLGWKCSFGKEQINWNGIWRDLLYVGGWYIFIYMPNRANLWRLG